MKHLLLGSFLLFSTLLHSQEYTPFNLQDGIWRTNYSQFGGTFTHYQYYCDGDTIINENAYFKLFQYSIWYHYDWVRSLSYYGAIANDIANKQVLLIKEGYTEPEIIYDFNLEIGDTIIKGIGMNDDLEVIDIDSVLMCKRYHKRYVVQQYHQDWREKAFVEGIGYTFGFVEPLVIDPFEETSELVCYTERGNEECVECELLPNGKERISQKCLSVFPNPAEGRLVFSLEESETDNFQLFIYNDTGKLVESRINISLSCLEINVQEYTTGMYHFKLFDPVSTKGYWGKFIVN